MLGIGACFWAGGSALLMVIPLLAVNWFGDSLDGTLARVRNQRASALRLLRRSRAGRRRASPRSFGGLMLGGHMSLTIGLAFLAAYYLLVVEISLATHARGTFKLAFLKVGPTELRILLAARHPAADAVGLRRRSSATAGCCSTSAAPWRSRGSCHFASRLS